MPETNINNTIPAVTLRDVSVAYSGQLVLDGVTLSVSPGAFVAIIGPNGGGKTTLLHSVLGMTIPTHGTVELFGQPPAALPAPYIGYVPQRKTLDTTFPATVLELVVTGIHGSWPWRLSKTDRDIATQALQRVGVEKVAHDPVATLSGGQLQRVYLARAMARRPKLMILDEPAAGMDVVGEAAMYHLLADYQKETGATVLMITHDWEGARYHATKVLLMNRRVIDFGAPEIVAREENLLQVFGHAGHVEATHGDTHDAPGDPHAH
jgi:zinc transport system ATP-binding protein